MDDISSTDLHESYYPYKDDLTAILTLEYTVSFRCFTILTLARIKKKENTLSIHKKNRLE